MNTDNFSRGKLPYSHGKLERSRAKLSCPGTTPCEQWNRFCNAGVDACAISSVLQRYLSKSVQRRLPFVRSLSPASGGLANHVRLVAESAEELSQRVCCKKPILSSWSVFVQERGSVSAGGARAEAAPAPPPPPPALYANDLSPSHDPDYRTGGRNFVTALTFVTCSITPHIVCRSRITVRNSKSRVNTEGDAITYDTEPSPHVSDSYFARAYAKSSTPEAVTALVTLAFYSPNSQ
ncbi:hypothetical protein EVAR_20878_1 [Eumeta japonica]|uniref:Uncharacterized protein n=1 Tax=Eumeta variegata TaxID=151549 RepID=A0A4C1UWN1_EUMVA|nr:hypothetical protein EVAR_20878_1 [Eumeta japonica]